MNCDMLVGQDVTRRSMAVVVFVQTGWLQACERDWQHHVGRKRPPVAGPPVRGLADAVAYTEARDTMGGVVPVLIVVIFWAATFVFAFWFSRRALRQPIPYEEDEHQEAVHSNEEPTKAPAH